MKFRWVSKYENWRLYEYYSGKKHGAKVQISRGKGNKYSFFVEREKDDFRFNSLWGTHPDQDQQKRLDNLPDMKFNSDQEVFLFVEKWMDENVPKLK